MRVDNVLSTQVGHLPAKLMVKLAPYIDSGDMHAEGIIIGEKGVRGIGMFSSVVISSSPTLLFPFTSL